MMRWCTRFVPAFCGLLLALLTARATPGPPFPYRIAPWYLFYEGALSLTFDDCDAETLKQIVPLLKERERPIRGTFFVSDGLLDSGQIAWPQLRELADSGQEVGLLAPPGKDAAARLRALREQATRELKFRGPWTLAYSAADGRTELATSFLGARGHGQTVIHETVPKDLTCLADYHLKTGSVEALERVIQNVLARKGWAIVTYGRRGDDFADQMDMILNYHARLWDAPVGDVLRYRAEARASRLVLIRRSPGDLTMQLTSELRSADGYNLPLSLEIDVPAGWERFTATQAGRPVWHGVVRGRARFNAVPNGGEIVLKKASF